MDNLKTLAGEALETINAIAKSANQRLGERGLTLDSMATVNHATAEVLAKRMQDRNLERSGNLLQLRKKPAIARLEIADEDDNIEVIYITPNAEISIAGIKICSYLNNEGKGRLLQGLKADAVLADKAYDSNALRALIEAMHAEAVIPSNRTRKVIIPHDAISYKQRNRIERCFNKLKHFRRFATRYDRRTIHFAGFVALAATMIWLN